MRQGAASPSFWWVLPTLGGGEEEEEEEGEEDSRRRTKAVVLGGDSVIAAPYPLELGETGDAANITSDILILRKYPMFA